MRNHSFSSLSTTNFDQQHEIDHLDDDPYDLNLSVSSLAKLNRRKPQISTILKLNLIIVLIISLFIKLTVVSVINGSLSAFLAIKLLTHGLILYTFMKKHYVSLQLLFALDVILFVIFLLFEFLLLVSNFAIIIIQHKRNKNIGFIGIWLMILIAAIDLLILVMVAIVLENYRKPKERLQQLEAKLVTVVHNGRLLASQMCKSGSYLLGFVCNNSAAGANQTVSSASTTNNGMLINGTPRIFRDSENPNQRISCMQDNQEGSSFSLNDDEYIHYSSVEMTGDLSNRFHSFSDFYNFNNRNALNNNASNENNVTSSPNIMVSNNLTSTVPTVIVTTNSDINLPNNANNEQCLDVSSAIPSSFPNPTTSLINQLNNLNHSIVTTGLPSLTTLATSSNFVAPISSTQLSSNQSIKEQQKKSLFERTNPLKLVNGNRIYSINNSTISSIINSNTNLIANSISHSSSENLATNSNSNSLTTNANDENTYVNMYQSNVDEDGDPIDGPLRCTHTTVINGNNAENRPTSSSHTIVQINRNATERALNCKPVYI